MPGHPSRILLIPCALLLLQACSRPDLVKPRNVILISLDTLRADHLGLYGYSRATSPHLDSLARESVVFDSAIAQSSTTSASHRALFQSKLASQTTPRGRALATVLEESGYRTAGFTGAGNVSAKIGFGIGFDIYEGDREGFSRSFPKAEGWLREQGDAPFFLFLHTYDPHLPYDPPAPHSTLF
jgi:arylsulfatase A-like enzyme